MTEGTDGPVGGATRGYSDTFDRFEASGSDRLYQVLIILLILADIDTHSSAPSLTWGITLEGLGSAG
jgi:hypothetical protein